MDLELEVATTPPQSVAGLIILLRQAFSDLVPFHEGTESYEEAAGCRTYRAILTAIQTPEGWQKGAARQAPDAPDAPDGKRG